MQNQIQNNTKQYKTIQNNTINAKPNPKPNTIQYETKTKYNTIRNQK
jgi:hypothetical protein